MMDMYLVVSTQTRSSMPLIEKASEYLRKLEEEGKVCPVALSTQDRDMQAFLLASAFQGNIPAIQDSEQSGDCIV